MKRTAIGSLLLAGAALAIVAATAYAAAPVRERVPIDEKFTFDDCGFLVEEHVVGVLQFTSWYDASGNRTRQIVTAPGARAGMPTRDRIEDASGSR